MAKEMKDKEQVNTIAQIAYNEGVKYGRNEVVKWIMKGGETPLGTDIYGYYIWKTKLQAKLKEWGL